jgi:phosphoribosylformylglycinamidine (FGAM) synthase-like enzyme
MTEAVVPGLADAPVRASLPRPMRIGVAGRARGAGARQYRAGLALSDEEIDYLATNSRLERDPTDVELMMFGAATRALPPQDLQRRLDRRRRTAAQSPFAMIRTMHATNPQGTIVAY